MVMIGITGDLGSRCHVLGGGRRG